MVNVLFDLGPDTVICPKCGLPSPNKYVHDINHGTDTQHSQNDGLCGLQRLALRRIARAGETSDELTRSARTLRVSEEAILAAAEQGNEQGA